MIFYLEFSENKESYTIVYKVARFNTNIPNSIFTHNSNNQLENIVEEK